MSKVLDHSSEAAVSAPVPWREPQRTDRQFAMHSNPPSVWPDFLVGQEEQPVRVLLVDDDPHVSHVIAQELLADKRIHLVGQAACLREGRRKVGHHDFDVMLVDLNLGDGCGFDLIERRVTALRHDLAGATDETAIANLLCIAYPSILPPSPITMLRSAWAQ